MTASPQVYVYITLSGEDKLSIFTLDSATGALDHRRDVPIPGGPAPLAADPSRRTLYVARRSARMLSSYAINGKDGDLLLINEAPLSADPCYLAVDRSGRRLLSAYYGAGKVTVHALDDHGAIGKLLCEVETAPHAHCIHPDAGNRFVFVPHTLEANAIYQFLFDAESGQLTPNRPLRLSAGPGHGPRHYVYHPHLPRLYFSNENGSSVSVYDLDVEQGTLVPLQTLSTLPAGWVGDNTCAQIHLHPSGNSLYVSNRGHDSIACYAVDAVDGLLSEVGIVSSERVPRVFGLSPDGAFLMAAGQDSGRLAVYRVNATSGALDPLHVYPIGERPLWVLALHLP